MAFTGYLIKVGASGHEVEIPLKYMRAETYTVTPNQRLEWSAERDVTGVLHRETTPNMPPKIEFNTPLMTNSDINALNTILSTAYSVAAERKLRVCARSRRRTSRELADQEDNPRLEARLLGCGR